MIFKLVINGYDWWSIYGFLVVQRWYALVVLQYCYSEFMVICYSGLLWWFGHMFEQYVSTSTLMHNNLTKPQGRAMMNITFCCQHISSNFKRKFSCIYLAKNTTKLCFHDQNHWNTLESHNEGCQVGSHVLNLAIMTNSTSQVAQILRK